MKKLYNKKTCIICDKEKVEGMHVYTAFICWECERDIVQTEPEEEEYADLVKKLSKIRKSSVLS
ncbi:sigma factor G inhibitor Gin [Bacillus sp. B190/17]|uniref:Sigma factor G inhibitor Gin n=1 Tax=Bacillus lumedeiriae TaxID=3058829 RepID=A0ABW8ICU9_9BACI